MSMIAISGKMGAGKDTVGSIIQYLTSECGDLNNKSYRDYETFLAYDGGSAPRQYDFHYQSNWEIKKFAVKLKQIVSILTGIPVEDLEKQSVKDSYLGPEWSSFSAVRAGGSRELFNWPTEKEIPEAWKEDFKAGKSTLMFNRMTVRQLLQEVGTDAMRNVVHPNIWINALFADYLDEYNPVIGNMQSNWIISDMRFPNELEAVKKRGGITIRVNRIINEKMLHDIAISSAPSGVGKEIIEDNKKYSHPSETALDSAEFDYIIENNEGMPELIKKVREILIKENIIQ